MKQIGFDFTQRIHCLSSASFTTVAAATGKRQVLHSGFTASGNRNDVLYIKRVRGKIFMTFAIFAAVMCALFNFALLAGSNVFSSHEQAGDRRLTAS